MESRRDISIYKKSPLDTQSASHILANTHFDDIRALIMNNIKEATNQNKDLFSIKIEPVVQPSSTWKNKLFL